MNRAGVFQSFEALEALLASDANFRARVAAIARKLEELHEYHHEQALLIAADIVLSRRNETFAFSSITQGTHESSAL